ncbi:phage virion morphogenesis protein [Budviciaceae bacterium CWB-B4]|uniref:Phage virion morphogenesis protein n=1 Tax=Limnobaculum xujianqingii TaxID=2738837 RepID=A0A9D7FS77_9GAMM|nr:phage virion morphogenesis protein [Limnobaculum xujianqingii]MBK5072568.1 phage virion morphogenesis protein [Limnobaculum xujianqingii]MBK5175877.1 phage virion morphogenesis protein [Limnobaculum xujianqingii]
MANNKISITLNTKALDDALTRLLETTGDTRPLMLDIAETLHAHSMKLFQDQGFPANSWPDLRPSTKKRRAADGHWPGKILQVSGQMIASIQSSSGPDYAQIGTNKVQARILHDGGTINRSGSVRLRTNKDGSLKKRGNLATFARKSHKNAVERAVNYQIVIPSRRFFPITADNQLIPPAFNAVMDVLHKAILGTP